MTLAYTPAAYVAAWESLELHTPDTKLCADVAGEIVATLRNYSQYVAVEVLLSNWPPTTPRLDRTVLAEAVTAAYAAMFPVAATADRPSPPELGTVVREGDRYFEWTATGWEQTPAPVGR